MVDGKANFCLLMLFEIATRTRRMPKDFQSRGEGQGDVFFNFLFIFKFLIFIEPGDPVRCVESTTFWRRLGCGVGEDRLKA